MNEGLAHCPRLIVQSVRKNVSEEGLREGEREGAREKRREGRGRRERWR